jgi:hypothetical protein
MSICINLDDGIILMAGFQDSGNWVGESDLVRSAEGAGGDWTIDFPSSLQHKILSFAPLHAIKDSHKFL